MLELNQVSYTVDQKIILKDASATLVDNEITSLIGPNGIGKSTLFKLITDSLKPLSGSITNVPKQIALLAQENSLYEPLTVRELLTIHQEDLDVEVVELLHLETHLDTQVDDLSGGQRQLVWLGYVLHQEPDLLLLDEPTTYLDLRYQQLFLDALKKLQKQRGFTVLMILHDLTQAFNYSQNIWLINPEKQIVSGKTEDVLDAELLSDSFDLGLKIIEHEGKTLIIS